MLPYNYTIVSMVVTQALIKSALENSVSNLNVCPICCIDGRFLQVSGVEFSVDCNANAGNRVTNLKIYSSDLRMLIPYNPTQTVTLATNSFIINGGDNYTMFKNIKYNVIGDEVVFLSDYMSVHSPLIFLNQTERIQISCTNNPSDFCSGTIVGLATFVLRSKNNML